MNYSGQIKGSSAPVSLAGKVPLLAKCPDMENRETINQPLFTGVAAVDTLTPLGRGQSILVAGLRGSGKTDLLVEAIIGQRSSGVRCVMSLIGEESMDYAQSIPATRWACRSVSFLSASHDL